MAGRLLIVFALNYVLHFFVTEAHFYLAEARLTLQVDVLYVLFAGLCMRPVVGALLVGLSGLTFGAMLPLGPAYALILLLLWGILQVFRSRLELNQGGAITLVSLFAQGLVTALLMLVLADGRLGSWLYWQRFLVDSLVSISLLAVVAYPWLRFQVQLLQAWGKGPDDER